MNAKSDQDVSDILQMNRRDTVSRLLKTMKSSRELSNARIDGSLEAMKEEVRATVDALAGHVLVIDDKIGEELVASSITRKDHMEALLPKAFTTQQRLLDMADVLFSKDEQDHRVSMLFFRKGRIVAVDHVVHGNGDPRDALLAEIRSRLGQSLKDMALNGAIDALGITKEEEPETSGSFPFDMEAEAKKQDGDAAAFARVDSALPESGAARRLFDLIRPYRDPSIRMRNFRIVKNEAIDHFLSYCHAHVRPLKSAAAKILDFQEYEDDINSRRHRMRRIRNAYGLIIRMPAYGRVSKGFEAMGLAEGEVRHVTIEPSTLDDGTMPSAKDAPRLIVETIDPELVERINFASDGTATPSLSPVIILYDPSEGQWRTMLIIGTMQIEYVVAFDRIDGNDEPVAERLKSILSRALSKDGDAAQAPALPAAQPTRTASAPPPIVARVRIRVSDVDAASRAIDAWHMAHLNKMGEDVLRSRAVEGSWLIEHLDGQDKTRRWSVRITAEATDRHVLTLELGADKARDLAPRMPAVLRRIAAATPTHAIDGPVHPSARTVVDRADVEELNRTLRDPTRALPIMLVSSHDESRLIEPDTLNAQTLGALDVWSVDETAYEMLEERIGADMGARAGECRMYMPGFTPDDSPFEHPIIHLSRSGQKRLSDLVSREIGATLWRYPSTYEGHDHTQAVSELASRERPEPLPDAPTVEKGLPRIPNYREIRRRVIPIAAREPAPSVHVETPTIPAMAVEAGIAHDVAGREDPATATNYVSDEPRLPLEDAPIVVEASGPPKDDATDEPVIEATAEAVAVAEEVPDEEPSEHDVQASPDHPPERQSFLPSLPETIGEDAGPTEEQPDLDLGDVPDQPVPRDPGIEADGEALRLKDIEVLFELYTEQMGETQSIMNDRIDAAVNRMETVARMMLTRMGISADELDPHVGPTAEQSRLREDDARAREHEIEVEEMKDEMRRLRAALETQRSASVARGVQPRPYPQHMSEVREWFDATLSGRIHIVSKAWKSMRKSSNEYPAHAVERMCRALELLAGPGLDMHCGDQSAKERWISGLQELRLDQSYDNTSTSGPVGKTERTVTYQGEKLFMNRHLRGTESGHNDRDLLRIYYLHHAETNQIVVGHLPSHLTTAAS